MKLIAIAIIATGLACLSLARSTAAADCDTIAADYETALHAAQVCDPSVTDSCAESRVRSLRDVCRCQTAVNPQHTEELDRLAADFKAHLCGYDRPVCNLACSVPGHLCTKIDSTASCSAR